MDAKNEFVEKQLLLHQSMKNKRENTWDSFWDEIAAMFTPELYMRPGNNYEQGKRFGQDLWDGYPQLALHTWSKGIPGNMIYENFETTPWMTLRMNAPALMNDLDVKKYCEARTEQVFWSLRKTNFYEINPQFCRYSGAIAGYLFPIVDHKSRSVHFYLEDPFYVWVERDIFGKLHRIHREFDKSIQSLADEFGEKNISKNRQIALKHQPFTEITILHGIFPNPDWDSASLNADQKPYVEFYIDKAERQLLYKGGVDFMPVDWCVEKAPRSTYPLTPAMFALTDAYGSDTLCKALYGVALESSNPNMRISKTLEDTYKEGPGGITWIMDKDKDIIEQVHKQLQWPVTDMERQHLQNKLDWWFAVEYWRLLSNIQGKIPTAYHIQQLQSEKSTLLGPQVSTYTRQVLDASVDILSQLEAQWEPLPIPDVLAEYLMNNAARELARLGYEPNVNDVMAHAQKYPMAFLEAKYTGVLTAIQSQVVHSRKYGEGLQFLAAAREIWPSIQYIVNEYPLGRHVLEAANWSEQDMRGREEYEAIVQQIQARQDLMEQAEAGKTVADAYKRMTKAPEEGSAAEMQMQQA